LDVPVNQDDVYLTETDQYGDLASYQAQPTTQTPTALVLQGLAHLYHLTEGVGIAAIDSSPNGTPANGVISGGTWANGAVPGSKVLLLGGSGSVDCPNTEVMTNKMAIGCWYSPAALVDQEAMIGKSNNYILQISGTAGAIRFGVHIGGSWVYLTTPAGTIKVNGRGFAIAVYDGTNMYLYVANPNVVNQLLTYSQAQTGSLDSSSADLFLGSSSFNGVVAEVMIWTRALSSQEVQELFFRPLTRIVTKSTTATLTGNAQPGDVIQGQTFYNTDPNNKLTGTLSLAFTRGFRIKQTLSFLIKAPTDHIIRVTRSLAFKVPTDHVIAVTRSLSKTLYVSKWFCDICSTGGDRGSTNCEGLNVVASGSTLTVIATPNESKGYVLPKVTPFLFDNTLVGSASNTTAAYTVAAQTVGTVHELKINWLKGFIVRGDANTSISGYNTYASGGGVSWSSVGSAGGGNHWEFYWNGVDVGRSSGTQYAADGTENTASCVIQSGA
jgi:hypothetical protein